MTEDLNVRSESIEEFYDIGQEIGSGQFAVVKKLSEKSSGKEFAAKFMKKKRSKALRRGMTSEQILREANVLRSVNHKGIIYLHDIFETKLEFVLVLELLSGGELFEFLSEQEYLTEDEAVGFLKQVIQAIEYLHEKSIVHLDIKPENIVLKTEGSNQIKLIDFGLARELTKGEMVREIMGTPEFVAPEIIAFEAVGTETDMWAIGVLTYIMLSGASPFLGDNDIETFSNISHVDYEFDDEYFKDICAPAKEFISDLLLKDPRDRLNAGECLKHEWMNDQNSSGESEEDDDVDSLPASKSDTPRNQAKPRRSTLIKTEAFKKFTARARWQKSVNKLIAISRLALLGKKNGPLTKGVLLQPNEPDTSSDIESNTEPQSIPLEKLDDSDQESTTEFTEDSVCSTNSARTANEEESEEITITTKNGSENGRKSRQVEENESYNDDEKDLNNKIKTPKSSEKISDSLNGEKTLDENQSQVRKTSGFTHLNGRTDKTLKKEQEKPEEKPVLPVAKPVQPVSRSSIEEKPDSKVKKAVLPKEKAVQPVLKSPVEEKPDWKVEKPVLPEAKPVTSESRSSNATIKTSATQPKVEVTTERKLSDKNTGGFIQKSSFKSSDIRTERKQEDTKSKSKFLFHDKNREDKTAKKSEPTKMKAGKFESLLSKFSKPHGASEEDSKRNKYAKEGRRLTSGSVKNNKITYEELEEPRTRRKSDQMGSRIDWQAIRAGRDERLMTELLKTNHQAQRSEGLTRSNQSYKERTGKTEALVRNTTSNDKAEPKSTTMEKPTVNEMTVTTSVTKTEIRETKSSKPSDVVDFSSQSFRGRSGNVEALARNTTSNDKKERSKSPTLGKHSATEKTITTSVTKTEMRKTMSSRPSNYGDSGNKQDDASVWVRRATTSKIEEKRKNFQSSRRGVLGLSQTSAKAEVMKWEQRQNNGVNSLPKRPTSSPLRSVTDRPLVKERQNTDTRVHNTTVTVTTKDKRKLPPVEMGTAVKDEEHTLLVQTSLPPQKNVNSESSSEVSENRTDSDSKVKTEESNGNRSIRHENGKPSVENAGKRRNVVENPQHESRKTENKTSKHKKDKERSEVKTEIQSGNTSLFPEFALTFQKILPAENEEDLPEGDDDFIWVMTSETNPNLELLTGMVASPKKSSHSKESRRRSTRSSEADTEPSVHVNSGGRRRSTKSSEADTEPSLHVNSGGRRRSAKSSEADTEPSVHVNSGGRRRSTKSSEAGTEPSGHLDSGRRRRSTKSSEAGTEPSVHLDSGRRRKSTKSSEAEDEPAVFESSSSRNTISSAIEIEPTVRLSSGNTTLVDASSDTPLQVTMIPMTSGLTTVNFEINTAGFKLK